LKTKARQDPNNQEHAEGPHGRCREDVGHSFVHAKLSALLRSPLTMALFNPSLPLPTSSLFDLLRPVLFFEINGLASHLGVHQILFQMAPARNPYLR
jgi:hypothetical protein